MERLTEERGERTWKLFHIGWYINILAFLGVLAWAFWILRGMMAGHTVEDTTKLMDMVLMMGLVVIAAVLLMGAGISRYQARLEGQHLELKLAVKRLDETVGSLKRGASRE